MGKLGPKELEAVIRCIKRSYTTVVPPKVGFDSGVHRILGDHCLVVSTDPCLGVPKPWFGWLLIHYAASDVAVSGAEPRYCTVNLLGSPGTSTRLFQNVMMKACKAARELHMQIVAGHTGRYEGLDDLVGVCTAYGFTSLRELRTPGDVTPGDSILCTKPLGLETLVTFAHVRRDLAKKLFGKSRAAQLSRKFQFQSCVKEAIALSKMPEVHAMHDAAEGGLVSALNDMAEASHVGFSLDFARIAIPRDIHALVRQFRLSGDELMSMSSTGTLVVALKTGAEKMVLRRLSEMKIPARIVGTFCEGERRVIKDHLERPFPRKAQDPFQKICRLAGHVIRHAHVGQNQIGATKLAS